MHIKGEIERLRQQEIGREEAVKAQLLSEIEQLVEKGIQGTLRQAKPYLAALDKTGCKDYLEELCRVYDLKYTPAKRKKTEERAGLLGGVRVRWEETPAVEALLETSVGVGESDSDWSEWDLSANRLADEIQGRFDEVRQNLIKNQLDADSIRKMVQDPAELEEFRQEIHEGLGVRETRLAEVKLRWDYRCVGVSKNIWQGTTTRDYGSNTIEAEVSREDDQWVLHINTEVSNCEVLIQRSFPEEEWEPDSIREGIVQGFLKLTRDSLG